MKIIYSVHMGAYASNFHDDAGSLVSEFTDPSQENWLSAHVAATGCKYIAECRSIKAYHNNLIYKL